MLSELAYKTLKLTTVTALRSQKRATDMTMMTMMFHKNSTFEARFHVRKSLFDAVNDDSASNPLTRFFTDKH